MIGFRKPSRKTPDRDEPARSALRGWVAGALGQPAGLELTISEVECADPACAGLETFILILRPGEATQAIRVPKPIAAITETDIVDAVRTL